MNRSAEHISFETLNDYVDSRLDEATVRQVEEHVAVCGKCSGELSELRELLDDVASLPMSVLPQDDVWSELKVVIERNKEVVLPVPRPMGVSPSQALNAPKPLWAGRVRLAASAVVLVAASSWITATVIRSSEMSDDRSSVVQSGAPNGVSGAPVLPTSFRVAEGKYVSTIEELRLAFDTQRNELSPETVRTVDRSLAVIDSAITEARAALLTDPGNRTLVDLLSASYERKLDLLRRTSELTPRT